MKKRMPKLMALVLTLALCFGSVQSVFAASFNGVNEKDVEQATYHFMEDVKAGRVYRAVIQAVTSVFGIVLFQNFL